jgi:hypothetical protein
MNRPLRELIQDYESDPTQRDVVETVTAASTGRRNRGGTSIQERLRHKATGEEMVRHTLLKPDGTIFAHPHFRRDWK